MLKRDKIVVLAISLIIIICSFLAIVNRGYLEDKLKNDNILSKIYEKNQRKKIEKIFDTRIKDKKLRGILETLSNEKMDIALSILEDNKVVDFLNNPDLNSYIENYNYNKAIENTKVIKEIKELSLLSPELTRYFKDELIKSNYDTKIKKIETRPEVIRIKERINTIFPISENKNTLESLSEDNLIEISEILSKSPITIEFVEKKDMKKYDLQEIVEISKNLYQIGQIKPEIALEIDKISNGFDIRKAALYGDLYVKDEAYERELKKEYEKDNYSFENPFLKYNPYGRTPLSYGMKYKTDKDESLVRVTILGKTGVPNFTYEKKYYSDELLPIVGLYPKTENTVIIEELNPIDKSILKTNKLKLKTYPVDDRLPAIYIEKRVPGSIQPGVNLVSYNLKEEGLPFAFDSMGNIRYILQTGKDMRKVKITKEASGIWELKNDEDKFQLNILGKVLGRIGREDDTENSKNKKVKYLVRNNNILTVVSYKDDTYPSALFSEYGLDSKDNVFKAILFYDKDGIDENVVEDGERVTLYEGDSDR